VDYKFFLIPKNVYKLLTKSDRKSTSKIIALLAIVGLIEILGIASIFPFLAVVSNSEIITDNRLFNLIYIFSQSFFNNMNINFFIMLLGLVCFALILISGALRIYSTYKINKFIETTRHNISLRLLTKYINQPYEYFTLRHSSELTKNIMSEIDFLIINILRPLMQMLSYLFVMIPIIILLLIINPLVLLIAITSSTLLYGLIYKFSRKRTLKFGEVIVEANKKRFKTISDIFNGIKYIKMQDIEEIYLKEYEKNSLRYIEPKYRFQTLVQTPKYFLEALVFGATIILISVLLIVYPMSEINDYIPLIGLYAVAAYKIQPGLNALYEGLSSRNYGKSVISNLSKEFKKTQKIKKFLSYKNTKKIIPKKVIAFNNVSFKYKKSKNIIDKLNLKLKVGSCVGIIGPSGSGKTTILDLICGLHQPTKGYISIDGQKIGNKNIVNLRKSIDYIQQNIFILDGSFAENISFGTPKTEIDHEKVIKCAKIAQLHEFISGFNNGYNQKVGEKGSRISGGQNQRIGIARALYRGPQILILDEATNALNVEIEEKVIKSVRNAMSQKTLIMVTHKLEILKYCDKIISIEKNKIKTFNSYKTIKN
jgi:ABC-type bacteriocin/lantibiotic exporter with double-glycine peptidase domain